jgi:hypothetical protein
MSDDPKQPEQQPTEPAPAEEPPVFEPFETEWGQKGLDSPGETRDK